MSILDRRKRLLSERANRRGDIEHREQERTMHNWYAMEVEAESRRQDYERERIAADHIAAAAPSVNGRGRFSVLRSFRPRFSLRSLVPVASAGAPQPAGC